MKIKTLIERIVAKKLKEYKYNGDPDMMSEDEVKDETLAKIKDLGDNSNSWVSRDILKQFTSFGFWNGEEMAIIDAPMAKEIAKKLYAYVERLEVDSYEFDEVADLL
jgi:hypothetical protein